MRQTLFELNMRKIAALALILIVVMISGAAVFANGESGDCGEDLAWTLRSGTLIIEGSGEMTDFKEPEMAPWYPYREEITRVEFPEGLTCVGDLAFFDCRNLVNIFLPNSVERVGDYAFADCVRVTTVKLSDSLKTIGEGAFRDCHEVTAVRLPQGLKSIGTQAFYRWESLISVTIPESVEYIGSSAFGYCKALVSATVKADIDALPDWMFYHCTKLAAVSIPEDVERNDSAFQECEQLTEVFEREIPREESYETGSAELNEDGTMTQESTTVMEGTHSSVSGTLEYTHSTETMNNGEYSGRVDVTISDQSGWKEAESHVTNALDELRAQIYNEKIPGAEEPKIPVNVTVTGTDKVDSSFVEALKEYNVQLTVTNEDGSQWRVDGKDLAANGVGGKYDFGYTLTMASPELLSELNTSAAYVLRFNSDAQGTVELMIPVGSHWARHDAALFQRANGELVCDQASVVDDQGRAHYYLNSVKAKEEYYIALDVQVVGVDAILPIELLPGYNAETFLPIQYEITGHSSDWNMEIGQVTWMMIGVIVFAVVCVGAVMFVINKQKMKVANEPWNQASQMAVKFESHEKREKKISIEKLKKKKDKK
ncbi:MAG: leucine-rich repeat domain-containing protein [Firmicutes bacterium]|nr:leucine-rich repeat domain-containing protein [Bacillota bacterium]